MHTLSRINAGVLDALATHREAELDEANARTLSSATLKRTRA